MHNLLGKYFSGIKDSTANNLTFLVEGILRCGSSSPWHAARSMCAKNGQSFKTNEKRANRLLQDTNFQIDDTMFRKYANLLFDALRERDLLKNKDNVLIRVDYTTDTDDFLILMASIVFCSRSVPLYFSMRTYPKRKNQHDQKKMESSFIKALKHLLPKGYSYTIVADRGFGNDRFAQLCEDSGFEYVLRINENLNLEIDETPCKLSDFSGKNSMFSAHVPCWKKDAHFEVKTEGKSTWFLLTSTQPTEISASEVYAKRFAIEKCFQDQKSSGFNIEKCKIKKYDRFKRLYFAMCIAQLVVVMIGEYIENKKHPIKKRYPILADLISVFSSSDGMPADSFSQKQLQS